MRGKRILFFEPDPETCRTAERALSATGSQVDICQDLGAAVAAVDAGGYELYILNCDPPTRNDPRMLAALEKLAPGGPGRVVLLTSSATEDYLPLLGQFPSIRNLVARNTGPLEPEELIITAGKLMRKDIFGIDKYLMWGVEPYTIELRQATKKAEYLKQVLQYADELGCNQRMIDLIDAIADEMITNAIFNAPRNPDGTPKYAHLPRREPVVLEDHEVGTLSFACDGNYLALGTVDPFGALNQDTVVSYLNRCMVKGPQQMSEVSGGAGLGLHRVFQSLSKFVLNLSPGKKTEVIALVDLRLSIRQFRQATKSFHIFVS
jgi:CheY-like chemotaxis protein